jgi:glycosyltransferase involved in cell wall biosynthesis
MVPVAEYGIDGISVHRIFPDRTLIPLWRRYKQLYNANVEKLIEPLLRKIKPDIIHFHNLSGLTLSPIKLASKAGIPAVITMHDYWSLCPNNMLFTRNHEPCTHYSGKRFCVNCFHQYDYWGSLPYRQAIIKNEIERGTGRIITPSRFMADRIAEAGYSQEMLRTIFHGLEIETFRGQIKPLHEAGDALFSTGPDMAKAKAQIESSDFLLQFAGHLTVHKGGEYLIRALSLLKKDHRHFTLAVTGLAHHQEIGRLRSLISALDIADNIIFLGKIDPQFLPSLYARADAVVVPSIWYENASVVIAEAMMSGTPVIASDIGGNPEFVENGHNGLTFKPKDHIDLSRKIRCLLEDPSLVKDMRKNALSRAFDLFNMTTHINSTRACYDEAIARRGG